MLYKSLIAASFVAASAGAVQAQGLSGGNIGIEYDNYQDNDFLGSVNYFGGLEYAITNTLSFGANIGTYQFEDIDGDNWNYTLHGIYDVGNGLVGGVFAGQDRSDDGEVTNYGIEGKFGFGAATAEGYLGRGDDDGDETVTYVGVEGTYPIAGGFGVIASYDRAGFEERDGSVSQISLGGEYTLQSGPQFYASVGRLSADLDNEDTEENFVSVGAKINFGPGQGTTFDRRSFFNTFGG